MVLWGTLKIQSMLMVLWEHSRNKRKRKDLTREKKRKRSLKFIAFASLQDLGK
jgi:hypothetical protein